VVATPRWLRGLCAKEQAHQGAHPSAAGEIGGLVVALKHGGLQCWSKLTVGEIPPTREALLQSQRLAS
jgi:hypothetical protein